MFRGQAAYAFLDVVEVFESPKGGLSGRECLKSLADRVKTCSYSARVNHQLVAALEAVLARVALRASAAMARATLSAEYAIALQTEAGYKMED